MPLVRSYGIPEQDARPVQNPYPQVPAAGDLASFGGNEAKDLQQAGQNLQKTADTTFGIYERMAKEANDTKVEGDLNTFIAGKQKALVDYTQTRGQDAIDGAKTVSDGLVTMKTQLLDGAKNAYQRDALAKRLDAQLLDATGTVTQHVAQQARALQVNTLNARSDLNQRQTALDRNDDAKIEGQLTAATTLGQERARLVGLGPDSVVAKDEALKEQEKILVTAIQARITDGNKRAAMALYEKYPEILKHNASVDTVMKGVRTEIDGENAANKALADAGLPQIRSGDGGNLPQQRQGMTSRLQQAGFSPIVSAGIAANFEHESGFSPKAVNPKDGSDGSNSIGLGQWNGDRAKALLQFAKSKGLDPNSEAAQIGYMRAELDGDVPFSVSGIKPDLKGRLEKASTPEEVASTLSREYFRPRAATEAQSRAQTAAGILTPTYKGDLKAGYDKASLDLQNRTDLSPEVRSSALAALSKQSTAITSYQTAATKALEDEADSYRTVSYLSPTGPDPSKMASFAARADALGNQSLATTYRLIASVAPTATNTLQSMPADQLKMLKSLERGPAAKLLEGMEAGRGDALAKANDIFEKVKKAQESGLDPAGLTDMAKQAAQLYADAGKSEKAREVAQTFKTMSDSSAVLKGNPVAQKQALADLEGIASTGQVNQEQAALHATLKAQIPKQQAAFDKDAYSAGRTLYGLPTLPVTDGAGRAQQVSAIASKRGMRPDQIAPFTDEEFAALRSEAGKSPQAAQKLFSDIAASGYPPEMFPLIGAGISGKDPTDKVSQGYAAAFSFYADKEPEVAASILDGVNKRKTMGDALRDMPKSDAFYEDAKTKMGNAFRNMNGVPRLIVNAAEAIYTSKMVAAGRQGEKLIDDDIFNAALDSVIGKTTTREGGQIVLPKGVSAYQFDSALRQLPSDNMVGLVTENGTPVTTEKMVRYGIFSNAGKDGQYYVEMNDPARGGRPGYVVSPGPRHEPLIVDIKPLLERWKANPGAGMETPNSARDARRQAPASPTANVEP